jgi:hypothetical protein
MAQCQLSHSVTRYRRKHVDHERPPECARSAPPPLLLAARCGGANHCRRQTLGGLLQVEISDSVIVIDAPVQMGNDLLDVQLELFVDRVVVEQLPDAVRGAAEVIEAPGSHLRHEVVQAVGEVL